MLSIQKSPESVFFKNEKGKILGRTQGCRGGFKTRPYFPPFGGREGFPGKPFRMAKVLNVHQSLSPLQGPLTTFLYSLGGGVKKAIAWLFILLLY